MRRTILAVLTVLLAGPVAAAAAADAAPQKPAVSIPPGLVRQLAVVGPVEQKPAFSLRFDGRQNFVAVPSDAALNPTGAMTLECWFKTTMKRNGEILGKHDWRGPGFHGYRFLLAGGRLLADWEGHALLGRPAADGQWHHAALTWDGTTRRLFQDGVKVAEDKPGAWVPATVEFRLGGVDSMRGATDFYDGLLSQVRLSKVDRYGGRDFTPPVRLSPDADTIACWDFAEGSGRLLRDASGHSHDGTLKGGPPPAWGDDAPPAAPAKTAAATKAKAAECEETERFDGEAS